MREDKVAGQVGNHRIGGRREGHRHNGQPVETIREIHRIGTADNNDHAEQDEEATERQEIIVHEGHRDTAGKGGVCRLHGGLRGEGGNLLGQAVQRAPLGMPVRRMGAMQPHDEGTGNRRNRKPDQQAGARRHAIGALLRHLGIVIEESEQGIGQRHEQHDPDIRIVKIAPEQHADQQTDPDQQAAHRGCALL